MEWLLGKPSSEAQVLMCCFRVSLENKMSLQILIGTFELVPMSQKTVAVMGRDKVLVNKMMHWCSADVCRKLPLVQLQESA